MQCTLSFYGSSAAVRRGATFITGFKKKPKKGPAEARPNGKPPKGLVGLAVVGLVGWDHLAHFGFDLPA